MNEQAPRINAPLLERFQGRVVRIVGKVLELHGETATIDSHGTIVAHLDRDSHLAVGHAAELVGKIQQDLSVKVLNSTDFGTNIDFKVYDSLVEVNHMYKEIFYDS
ncbi:replication factor A protein 3 [Morchella snyderi]|nr:replication factor A protein 3 [Morchella snyderi]